MNDVEAKEDSEGGFKPGPERERAAPPPGAIMPLDDLYYPQLYQHSRQLGLLARWNGRGVIAGAGVLALGGALGGLVAGAGWTTAVVACTIGGVALLLGALFIGRTEIASAKEIKIAFDQTLSMYKQKPEIRAIHEHLESELPPKPEGLIARYREFFNV
jgi:hypothetical protein